MPEIAWVYLIIIVGGIILGSFIHMYRYRNWKLIYTALGQERYFNIVSKLKSDSVTYKVKIPIRLTQERSFIDNTQYDIYVKKQDVHLASKAMQKKD